MHNNVCSNLWEIFTWTIQMPVFTQSRKGVPESELTFTIVPWLIRVRRQHLLPALHPPCSCTQCAGKQQWSRCLEGKQALFGEYHQPLSGWAAGQNREQGYWCLCQESTWSSFTQVLCSWAEKLEMHIVLFSNSRVKIRNLFIVAIVIIIVIITNISKYFIIQKSCKHSA